MNLFNLSQRVLPVFLITLLVALAGCDSSGPEVSNDSADLVGAWALQSSEPFAIVSASEADRVPGTESLTEGITADNIDLPFKYIDVYESGQENEESISRFFGLKLFTYPGGGFSQVPDGVAECVLSFEYHELVSGPPFPNTSEPFVELSCNNVDTGEYDGFEVTGEGFFAYDPDQMTLSLSDNLVLYRQEGNSSSDLERRLTGSLEFPVTPIPADTPTRVTGATGLDQFYSLTVFPVDTTVEFLEDGTYRSTYTAPPGLGFGSGLIEETGSWSVENGTLTMVGQNINGESVEQSVPVSLTYEVLEGQLDLEFSVDACGTDPSCLGSLGSALRLRQPDNLQSLTRGVAAQFGRTVP